jgi:hypothetical protein
LIESPLPPVTDSKTPGITEKNIKDFSRQYLKEGMWPGKINHNAIDYQRQSLDIQPLRPEDRRSVEKTSKVQVLQSSSGDKQETRIKPYQ